jgi:hypothetical protein
VAELADALDLGSSGEIRTGSSPVVGTILEMTKGQNPNDKFAARRTGASPYRLLGKTILLHQLNEIC